MHLEIMWSIYKQLCYNNGPINYAFHLMVFSGERIDLLKQKVKGVNSQTHTHAGLAETYLLTDGHWMIN